MTTQSTHATAPVGAIDMGSKNFKFVLGRKSGDDLHVELVGKSRLEIGREISENHGVIGPAKFSAMEEALTGFVDHCRKHDAEAVLAIATSAIRNARNHRQVEELARELGIAMEIADGPREGRIDYLAATLGAPGMFVSDAGSRSMQVAWESGGEIIARSVPVGYELAYESFFEQATTLDEAEVAFGRFLDGNFVELPQRAERYYALAANNVSAFANRLAGSDAAPGLLHADIVKDAISTLRRLPSAAFEELKETLPKAQKVLPGLLFIAYLMERTGHREVAIAAAELPVGLIVEYFALRS